MVAFFYSSLARKGIFNVVLPWLHFFRKKSASKVCSSGSAARYLHWSKSFSEVTIEYLGKISFDSKILYQHTFSYNGWPSKPFLPKRVGWLCPVRSAIKRTFLQDLNSFFIMFYYIISTTYQKIGDQSQ